MFEMIKKKVALITGGASGIGLAYTKELLKNGLKGVAVIDLDAEKGPQVVKDLEAEFGANKAIFVKADISNRSEFEEAFKQTINVFNQLDIVINNAGLCNDSQWEREVAVNINGTIHGCLLALENYLPKYKSGPEGIIVNTASLAGLAAMVSSPIYTATKHAIVGLGMSLGKSELYEKTNIRVLTICPGKTYTPLLTGFVGSQIGPEFVKFAKQDVDSFPGQSAECVAKGLVKALNEGKSGSFWIVEEEEPAYEIEIPLWKQLRV